MAEGTYKLNSSGVDEMALKRVMEESKRMADAKNNEGEEAKPEFFQGTGISLGNAKKGGVYLACDNPDELQIIKISFLEVLGPILTQDLGDFLCHFVRDLHSDLKFIKSNESKFRGSKLYINTMGCNCSTSKLWTKKARQTNPEVRIIHNSNNSIHSAPKSKIIIKQNNTYY